MEREDGVFSREASAFDNEHNIPTAQPRATEVAEEKSDLVRHRIGSQLGEPLFVRFADLWRSPKQ